MPVRLTRRAVLTSSAFAGLSFIGVAPVSRAANDVSALLAELELQAEGRLGVAVLDLEGERRIRHRADERFPLCSTFKFLAAAFVLARVDRGEEDLSRRVIFGAGDLVPYSPKTEGRTGEPGMTLAELCEAAMIVSDNTAGNLLLDSFDGPPALTAYARSLGDTVTRLDRREPELNEAAAGDPRDTTTPAAMLEHLRAHVLEDALSDSSRERLTGWLLSNTTGDSRLRAGFPTAWRIGDKTGTSVTGVTNDIAVVWPPNRAPLIVAAYLAESTASSEQRDSILAEVARIIAATI